MARSFLAWIPAYAGTTMYLSLSKSEAHGFSRRCDPLLRHSGVGRSPGLCAHVAQRSRLDPGLRRDDNVFKSLQVQSARFFAMMCSLPSSLRRRPESVRPRGHHISAVQVRVEASHDLVVEGNCVAV